MASALRVGEAARRDNGGGGSALALLASRRSEGKGRARAGEWRGSRASSTSSRPACGAVRPSQARGGHTAATSWPRSAMTGLVKTAIRPDEAD